MGIGEFDHSAKRFGQIFTIGTLIAALVGAGIFGGRLLSSIETLNGTVARLDAQVTSMIRTSWELQALRERVDRLEQQTRIRQN